MSTRDCPREGAAIPRSPLSQRPRKRLRTGLLALGATLALGAPLEAAARGNEGASAMRWTLNALQKRHNRVLYEGVQSFRSNEAPSQEAIVGDNTDPWGMAWTKCTNIGIHLMSTLVAEHRALIDANEAKRQIKNDIDILARVKGYRGIFPENIKIKGGIASEVVDGRIRFSSIDSAWVTLALSLVEARYRGEDPIADSAGELIHHQDYRVFVGADGLLGAGFYVDDATDQVADTIAFSYSDRNSEARPLVLALVGMGQLPETAWDKTVYEWSDRDGLAIAKGWHFSAFVEMTGALFFDESKIAPLSLGKSHQNYLEASLRVAHDNGHRFYGYAPACDAQNPYAEFGLDRPKAVTPYAAALLTLTGDPRSYANFNDLLQLLPRDGSPLADGLDPTSGKVSCGVARVLDQGLAFLALNADTVRSLVRKTPWYASAEQRLQAMDQTHRAPEKPESAEPLNVATNASTAPTAATPTSAATDASSPSLAPAEAGNVSASVPTSSQ